MITPYPDQTEIHARGSGVGHYSDCLAKALSARNVQVEVWGHTEKNLKEYEMGNISVKRVWTRDIKGLFNILKKILKDKPNIIHIQHEFNMFGAELELPFTVLMPLIARAVGVKVVTTIHGGTGLKYVDKDFVKENGKSLPPFVIRLAFRYVFGLFSFFSNKIIVHENFQKNELVIEHKIRSEKITVMPIGVAQEKLSIDKTEARRFLDIGDEYKKVFLYMGFAAKYKGLPELYDAYKKYIQKEENKNTLLIIGAGPAPRLQSDKKYMNWYNELKEKYDTLGQRVKWAGFIESKDIEKYYSASDAILFPYSRRIAASGPMAIAIGYEKDIVLSNILSEDTREKIEYNFDFENTVKTNELKKGRVWSIIADKTAEIYKS